MSRQWWSERRDEVVVADVRKGGLAGTRAGHLPGAVLVDLDRWLAAPPSPERGRHPLPAPEVFAEGMSRAGIADHDTVVAYDDEGGVTAARLVWMLRALGRDAALLDGGWRPDEDGTSVEPSSRPAAVFTALPWPAVLLASPADAADPAHVVLDARTRERFAGGASPLDPRPGHVPGARSFPARDSVGVDGLLLPVEQLRERLAAVGVGAGSDVVAYCGSGVTACHDLLVLEHAGFAPGRLYPGSWSQWASDPDAPAEF